MARVLLVGCGCRGQALARALIESGHPVRGTTRRPERADELEAAGVETVVADPDRLATLTPHLFGITIVCWLLGTAGGDPERVAALHHHRLETMLEEIVDTPVRALVYEGAGTVPGDLLEGGAAAVRRAAATYMMPAQVVTADPADRSRWVTAMTGAVEAALA